MARGYVLVTLMSHSTKKLSKRPLQHSQMDAFCEPLDHCQLEDLGFRGYQFL